MRTRYVDIQDRTQDLAEDLRAAPEAVREEFLQKYELSWIHHENALEGVVYSGQELAQALAATGPLAEASTLSALRDVRNLKAAIDLVRARAGEKKVEIDQPLVRKLYETLHAGWDSKLALDLRREIPLHRAYFHEIAPPARIPALLAKLLDSTRGAEFRGLHPIHAAARLAHGFMQVFPYTDGTGKIARLLANLVLLHHGYQPCIIHTIDRHRYYDALRLPEAALRDLMVEAMENGLENAEGYLRASRRARNAAR